MKTSLVVVSFVGIGLVVGTAVHLRARKAPPNQTPVVDPASDTQFTRPARLDVPSGDPVQALPQQADQPAQVATAISASSTAAGDAVTNSTPPRTPFGQAMDTLVSPQASFEQKQAAWRQLREAGQLDQAIEALKQGAEENPASAAYPAALGQAQLQKADVLSHNAGTISEMGILGMQADQNFDAALKRDPADWEAQFFKAVAMSYWPLELNKGDEVIQRLSRLIDQQETMTLQPQFAQTYVVLGDQYRKMGKPDYAAATWLIGAQKFPGNAVLRQRIDGK
jgi:tetratricopeptide (TPR) repeat protein